MKFFNLKKLNNALGFTLVELMVVLVVIIIGTSIAVVTFQNRAPYYRLKGSTREVLQLMQLAQSTAIRKNTLLRIALTSNTNFHFQQFTSGAFADITDETNRLGLASIALGNGIRFTVNPCASGNTYPCFTPVFRTDGTINAGSGGTSLDLTNGKDTKRIQWTIGGGIRVP